MFQKFIETICLNGKHMDYFSVLKIVCEVLGICSLISKRVEKMFLAHSLFHTLKVKREVKKYRGSEETMTV